MWYRGPVVHCCCSCYAWAVFAGWFLDEVHSDHFQKWGSYVSKSTNAHSIQFAVSKTKSSFQRKKYINELAGSVWSHLHRISDKSSKYYDGIKQSSFVKFWIRIISEFTMNIFGIHVNSIWMSPTKYGRGIFAFCYFGGENEFLLNAALNITI